MSDKKVQIRPIYQELQDYLSQIPLPKYSYENLESHEIWERVNSAIDELQRITGNDFSKFKITAQIQYEGEQIIKVNIVVLRTAIHGLIGRLHGEYFPEEPRPFGGSPSTVISQTQSQEQTTNVNLILAFQEQLIQRLNDEKLTRPERSFLENVKEGLATVKSYAQLLQLVLSTAKALNLDLNMVKNALGI
jgi:hypothetical protein